MIVAENELINIGLEKIDKDIFKFCGNSRKEIRQIAKKLENLDKSKVIFRNRCFNCNWSVEVFDTIFFLTETKNFKFMITNDDLDKY